MAITLELPDRMTGLELGLEEGRRVSWEDYESFCAANPELRTELSAEGRILLMPPAGAESDFRSLDIGTQIYHYARRHPESAAFTTSVQYLLPDGAALSPDASWVSAEKMARLNRAQKRGFLPLVPDLVVEVLSPSDRMTRAQAKMRQWSGNGVPLAWLVDADRQAIHIYRPGQEAELRTGMDSLEAGEAMPGFVLDCTHLWKPL
ncbi:MAG: Uma2 family endonuclease [Bryobacter sp.]|nr:Uma2 family endonuclease [Bryobacter sp.]